MTASLLKPQLLQAIERSPYRERIKRVSLFGSRARREETLESDVDLLIELEPALGYFGMARLQRELSEAFQHPVDLLTPGALSPYIREQVQRESLLLYEG